MTTQAPDTSSAWQSYDARKPGPVPEVSTGVSICALLAVAWLVRIFFRKP